MATKPTATKSATASLALAALLAACATASPVMPVEDGTYLISAHAAPARGGAAGAQGYAFEQAQAFCAAKGQHAVVVAMADRDVQQSAFSATPNAAFGASLPGGNANLRFRCAS